MAQQSTSPSMTLRDGNSDDHQAQTSQIKSNSEVPVDPNIAASSPTYPPYSPYAPHDMSHYQGHPPPGYPPHNWPQQHPGYGAHGMPGGPYSSPGSATTGTPASAGPRSNQVSLVYYFNPFHILSLRHSLLTHFLRFTPSSQFLAHNSTSVPAADTKKLSVCTSAAGKDVRRRTVP